MSGPGTITAPVATRPGTSRYAPSVRIVRLGDLHVSANERSAGEAPRADTVLPNGVLGDLVRADVTRVNTGASQYSLSFNNWYLGAGPDPTRQSDERGTTAATEETDTPTNAPFWPRFKYNDFALLRFGERLRVDLRYVPEPTGRSVEPGEEEQTWTPMVAGPITDIRFNFAAGQGATVTVSGEDDLSLLKDKQEKRVVMNERCELSIVKRALTNAGYTLPVAPPLVGYPPFVVDDNQGLHEAIAAGQSTLDFIQKLAARLDFEVFLEFAAGRTPPVLEFHFEPYRGRAKPDPKLRPLLRLERGVNLIDFSPTIKVVDQYSSVEVKGRHRDPLLPREVEGKGKPDVLADELHVDERLDGTLRSGPDVRAEFFKNRENRFTVQNQSNLDDVRAEWAARAVIRGKARELFTIEATTIGVPQIRPGLHVEIRGMRAPFDGFYYITKAVHTFGADGYRTRVSAARPGMELPTSRPS